MDHPYSDIKTTIKKNEHCCKSLSKLNFVYVCRHMHICWQTSIGIYVNNNSSPAKKNKAVYMVMNNSHKKKAKEKTTCLLQQLLNGTKVSGMIPGKEEARLCTVYTLLYYLTNDNHILLWEEILN